MEDRTYNGWTNYETWAVGMFLDGNHTGEGTYLEVQEILERIVAEAPDHHNTGNIWTLEETRKFTGADALKDYVEQNVVSDDYDGLRGDLVGAALSEVNWDELAENKLSALAER